MSRSSSTSRPFAAEAHADAHRSDVPRFLEPERLRRLAALIAVGDAPLPEDLEPGQLSIVLAEAARLRRDRLVHLVARAIAADIHGAAEP